MTTQEQIDQLYKAISKIEKENVDLKKQIGDLTRSVAEAKGDAKYALSCLQRNWMA